MKSTPTTEMKSRPSPLEVMAKVKAKENIPHPYQLVAAEPFGKPVSVVKAIVLGLTEPIPSLENDQKDAAAPYLLDLEEDILLGRLQDTHQEEPDTLLKEDDCPKAGELNSHQAVESTVEKRNLQEELDILEALVQEDTPHTRI